MISDNKAEMQQMLWMLRGAVADGKPEERAAVQAAEEETRAFIEKLKADHPDGTGLLGGMIAALECVVNEISNKE
ncbi:TPA: hypothetical protein RMN47_000318 [Escherichia coli]|nr:hypothetical protein [Escherichia coli]